MTTGLVVCLFSMVRRSRGSVVDTVAELGREGQAFRQRRPQAPIPLGELTVEVGAGVAFAARVDAAGAVRLELGIDQGGYGLVGGGPVHVAAAEDGKG